MQRKVRIERLSLRLRNISAADAPRIAAELRGTLSGVASDLRSAADLEIYIKVDPGATPAYTARAVSEAIMNATNEGR